MKRIGVFGAGTMGMSLARMLYLNGHEVVVWSATERDYKQCKETRRHRNLEGMVIPDEIRFTREIGEACEGADLILSAVASVKASAADSHRSENPVLPAGKLCDPTTKRQPNG